jgi:hypothetical protein
MGTRFGVFLRELPPVLARGVHAKQSFCETFFLAAIFPPTDFFFPLEIN